MDEKKRIPEKDFAWQQTESGDIWLQILTTLANPANLYLSFETDESK